MYYRFFLPILITKDDVMERLNKLNINISEGLDLIHCRIIYEMTDIHESRRWSVLKLSSCRCRCGRSTLTLDDVSASIYTRAD